MIKSAEEHRTDETRFEEIRARLAEVRLQTLELATRAATATGTSTEMQATGHSSYHAEQVQQMASTIEHLEHELEGLRVAMETRGVIEQAKGMLMLERHCSADEAFSLLVDFSQTSHRKLVEVARTLVASWTAEDRAST